jgi:hypothetical protein
MEVKARKDHFGDIKLPPPDVKWPRPTRRRELAADKAAT